MNEILTLLNNLQIKYQMISHPPVFTVNEANLYIKTDFSVKCLFLSNRQNTKFYLVIIKDDKKLDLKNLNHLVGIRLSLAKESKLEEKLGVKPGSVSLFGLINNKEKDVTVIIDSEAQKATTLNFHPNDNTVTIFITPLDTLKILKYLNFPYQIVDL